MNDWNKITSHLRPILKSGFWQLNLITSLNTWQCLAKTPRLRTRTQNRSSKAWKPRMANFSSDGILHYTKKGLGILMFTTFYRNLVWIRNGEETSSMNLAIQLNKTAIKHSVFCWDLWKLRRNTFWIWLSSFSHCLLWWACMWVLYCSSRNLLWRAILSQRFNWGAVCQFLLSMSQHCMTFFLSYSFPFKASLKESPRKCNITEINHFRP